MKRQKVIRVFQLLCGVTVILFIAGIVIPSLLHTKMSASQAGFAGSLHVMKIAGMSFTFKLRNIFSAILGAAFGAGIALMLASSALSSKIQGLKTLSRFVAPDARLVHRIGLRGAL
jgi:hypothetical protein